MAYEFNGSNQYISAASALGGALPLSLALLFKPTRDTDNECLFSIASSVSVNSYVYINYNGSIAGDPIRAQHRDTALVEGIATSTAAPSVGAWNHACAVFAGGSSRTIYLNGGNSGNNTTSVGTVSVNQLSIGNLNRTSPILHFSGGIAEVGAWNAALTAAEIASLAAGMTCDKVRPQSLVFYAPLVRELQDVKGGLTITNNNTATVAAHPRVYA